VNRLETIGVWIGGAALLAVTATDTFAVIGRNIGLPIIGSIELVQPALMVSGIVALALATAGDEHARVRILAERIGRGRGLAETWCCVATALFFALLLIGSGWLAFDLWNGHETSEVLGIPWALVRLAGNLGLAACIVAALARIGRQGPR
jgi:TRAP-type C4-dicarboxylate transport system permease small subunit